MIALALAWLIATGTAGTALAAYAPRAVVPAAALAAVLAPLFAAAALICAW